MNDTQAIIHRQAITLAENTIRVHGDLNDAENVQCPCELCKVARFIIELSRIPRKDLEDAGEALSQLGINTVLP